MAAMFFQVLCLMDQVTSTPDPISSLPTELISTIFRHLDSESLVAAAGVNRRWKGVCKNDKVLRGKIRRRLRKERKERKQAYLQPSAGIQVIRTNPGTAFGQRNGNVQVVTKPVRYDFNNNESKPQGVTIRKQFIEEPKVKNAKRGGTKMASKKKSVTYTRLRL